MSCVSILKDMENNDWVAMAAIERDSIGSNEYVTDPMSPAPDIVYNVLSHRG